MTGKRSGGYEAEYAACDCFWGVEPGTFVRKLASLVKNFSGLKVLDVGCGEGKNAAFLAGLGAEVTGMDISERALQHAKRDHGTQSVKWVCADVSTQHFPEEYFDVIVAYGFFHCLSSADELHKVQLALSKATKKGGYHVVCSFNDRKHDLAAHPGFSPCLVPHDFYVRLYQDWIVEAASDDLLYEIHPHNLIPHHHSLTRLLARNR